MSCRQIIVTAMVAAVVGAVPLSAQVPADSVKVHTLDSLVVTAAPKREAAPPVSTITVDPATLRRTWASIREIMAPGALDPLVKEMLYVAVSTTNQCGYCIASHTAGARKAGMTDAMFAELMAVVGMANATNRLAGGYQVEIDARFQVNPGAK